MSDDNNDTKEPTMADKIERAAWITVGLAIATWAIVTTILSVLWWCAA